MGDGDDLLLIGDSFGGPGTVILNAGAADRITGGNGNDAMWGDNFRSAGGGRGGTR